MQISNVAAKISVRPSEGMAEGGCGGNSAMPERIELPPRHLPEYLEGRIPKKNVLSFLEEKIGRAQIRKARDIFLWCCRAERGSGGATSLGVFRKMGSDFFKQTPPFRICRRSCLGASPLGIGFRQEISAQARAKGAGEVNLSSNSELWTYGESNSSIPDANRAHYHYAIGPIGAI